MLDVSVSVGTLGWLALAAFVAGWVDAVAGGGGTVTVPALLAAGLPPHVALGTNKAQAIFGSTTALIRYARAGLVDPQRAKVAFPAGFVGALLGAQLVLMVPAVALRPVVLVLLVAVALLLALRPPISRATALPRPSARRWLAATIALVVGTYDGFFGPGTGTFLIVAFVLWFDADLTRASANAKVVNFASNLASVILFAGSGAILWRVALSMAGAQLAGAYLGSHSAIKGGDRIVRPVVLVVVLVLVCKLGYDLLS